jgi:hypothetical protein
MEMLFPLVFVFVLGNRVEHKKGLWLALGSLGLFFFGMGF